MTNDNKETVLEVKMAVNKTANDAYRVIIDGAKEISAKLNLADKDRWLIASRIHNLLYIQFNNIVFRESIKKLAESGDL